MFTLGPARFVRAATTKSARPKRTRRRLRCHLPHPGQPAWRAHPHRGQSGTVMSPFVTSLRRPVSRQAKQARITHSRLHRCLTPWRMPNPKAPPPAPPLCEGSITLQQKLIQRTRFAAVKRSWCFHLIRQRLLLRPHLSTQRSRFVPVLIMQPRRHKRQTIQQARKQNSRPPGHPLPQEINASFIVHPHVSAQIQKGMTAQRQRQPGPPPLHSLQVKRHRRHPGFAFSAIKRKRHPGLQR